jgi:DNA repair exonuclease SbcCD nuclease subunit
VADLAAASIDYWALGHIHRQAVLRQGAPWIVYAGNTQGRSAKPAELGAKGAVLVEVDGGSVRSLEFVPTDSVRFLTVDLDLSELGETADLSAVRAELARRVLLLRETHDGLTLLVRAIVRGRSPLHDDLGAAGRRDDLLRDLRESFNGVEPPLWWEDLKDRTAAEIDFEVVRARDDFTSSLLVRAEGLARDPAGADRLRAALTPTSPVDLLRRCPPPDEDEFARLLEAAKVVAVEALEAEVPPCA